MLRPMSMGGHLAPGWSRIVLTGFMGCGKTTVGRLLATGLGWTFIDLDDATSEREGLSVPQIFAQHGEAAFRAAELAALADLLQIPRAVIALGGGAPETEAVRDLLKQAESTLVVYLKAPFALLYERCARQALEHNATSRPLLGRREETQARFERRKPLYADMAACTISAGLSSPEAVAAAILATLPQLPPP